MKNKINNKQISDILEISESHLSRLANDNRVITVDVAKKIREATGLTFDFILTGKASETMAMVEFILAYNQRKEQKLSKT